MWTLWSTGVNGAVNGRSLSPSAAKGTVSASASPSPALRPPEHSRTLNAKARDRKASHHSNSTGALQEKPSQKTKEKVRHHCTQGAEMQRVV